MLLLLLVVLSLIGIISLGTKKSHASPELSNVHQQLEKFASIYKEAIQKPWPILAPQQLLKMGISSQDVVMLRERLQFTGDLAVSSVNYPLFDKKLEEAVLLFQHRHGLIANGQVTKETLAALNVSPEKRMKQLQANIERWKHFEQKQSRRYLWVNIPDYHARLIENEQVSLIERVIIGKPSNPTPELYSKMTDIMLNPYWIVPKSIAKKNLIPKAINNPSYLEQQNIRVFLTSTQEEVPLAQVDWTNVANNVQDYFFRQEPGPHNPLGQIKFKITNKNSIYLHDTSSKQLFDESQRALSSGCIRLQNPFSLFAKLAEDNQSVSKQQSDLKSILKSGETLSIKLNEPLPVYITYLTAWVDNKGLLHFAQDVYNRDVG